MFLVTYYNAIYIYIYIYIHISNYSRVIEVFRDRLVVLFLGTVKLIV